MEKEKVWNRPGYKYAKAAKETRKKNERRESSRTGVNHISTDTAAEAVDSSSTTGC